MAGSESSPGPALRKIPVGDAAGTVLAHDITEIVPGACAGPAFRRGHVVCPGDICHLRRLGKEHLYVFGENNGWVHEDDAAPALAEALMGDGVRAAGPPREGKVHILAGIPGLLRIRREALFAFNLLGDVACATLHENTTVERGQVVAHVRAIPLLLGQESLEGARRICREGGPVLSVVPIRAPRAGILITGNEVSGGLIKDSFADVVTRKIQAFGGDIAGIRFAPDDETRIAEGISDLLAAGSDLLVTTGGMSVDPDDVTRFAIRKAGARDIVYGSAASPGAMFLSAVLDSGDERGAVPILGVPACALHAPVTAFDLILPRILAGERIGRRELAALGHGGLCRKCTPCHFPACPFGK